MNCQVAMPGKNATLSSMKPEGKRRWRRMSADLKADIVQRYLSGESAKSISRSLDYAEARISQALNEGGVVRRSASLACRKHAINEAVFDQNHATGDLSEPQLYWIGMLMADGCVIYDARTKGAAQISLQLQSRDRAHVEKLKAFLAADHPLLEIPAKHRPQGKGGNTGPSVRLTVGSIRIARKLGEYGVIPRKALVARASDLVASHKDVRHFWRGCVDGDGTVRIADITDQDGYHYRRPYISLSGSEHLCRQFSGFVKKFRPNCPATVHSGRTCHQVHVYGDSAACIIKQLYENCSVALERKATAALEAIHVDELIRMRRMLRSARTHP